MSETAFQKQYRQEFIKGFEQRQSLLRSTTTTEAVIKGNQARFLVADSNNDEAVTRGVNGLIPARGDNLAVPEATLQEWHDLRRKTRFNIFASQGNQRRIMQMNTMAVINRKVDSDIIGELSASGAATTGGAVTADLGLVMKAKTRLGNNDVPWDANIFAVITPAFEAYLMQIKEFSNREYIDRKPFPGADAAWEDQLKMYRWMDVNWLVHPNLNGKGTASEECYMYHQSAIGHAFDSDGMQSLVGYDQEQDYSWARCSSFMGSKTLQSNGIIIMNHDGSAYA